MINKNIANNIQDNKLTKISNETLNNSNSKNIYEDNINSISKNNVQNEKFDHMEKPKTLSEDENSTSYATETGYMNLSTLKNELIEIKSLWNGFNHMIRVIEFKNSTIQKYKQIREKFTKQEIKKAITNYAEILSDDKYILTHKWELEAFLAKIDKFTDKNFLDEKYLKGEFKNHQENKQSADSLDDLYQNLDEL